MTGSARTGPAVYRRTVTGAPTPIAQMFHWLKEFSGVAHALRVAASRKDPWRRFDIEPPLRAFGPGAVDFRDYLARRSRIHAATPADIAGWLLGCRYAHDHELLDELDHWLHPVTFEIVRSGDCEDFALWAWRKLVEARFEATFVVGARHVPGHPRGRHAWVIYRDRDEEYLLDGVERSIERIIRPVGIVRREYEPQVGADATGRRFIFGGLYREPWASSLRLRPK